MHKYNIYYKATPPECEGQLTPTAASSSSSNVIDFEHLSASFPDTFGVEYRALQERRRTWSDIRRKRREIDDEADRMDLDDGGGDDATAKSSFSTHVTPSFVLALSSCLLRRDFGLEHFDVPAGRLCPPVPGRLNYICWLRELLEESRGGGGKLCAAPDDNGQEHGRIKSRLDTKRRRKFVGEEKEEEQIIGIDIGTGSSAIFPLLGVRQFWSEERTMDANMNMNTNTAPNSRRRRRPPWYFLATDVDPIALASARHNVASNGMSHRISVLAARPDVGPVRAAMEAAAAASARPPLRYDFCMTNPPFYSDAAEATEPRRGDARSRTDMCAVESVYGGGGEVGFVSNMIDDSLVYREAIGWYTSMLGKKSSMVEILRVLKAKGFGRGNVQTTQFVQGRSVRWGIAWTFREGPARTLECKLATRRFVAASNPYTDIDLPPSAEEIVKRLLQYYTTVSAPDNVRISPMRSSDEDGNCIITFVGHSCPKVDNGLTSKEERWFTIDATVHASRLPDGSNNCTNAVATALNVECYVYVDAGKKIALGIVDRMEGEVFRTNRRWRRLLTKGGNKGKI